METQGLNLFIVDDNRLTVSTLKQYLLSKFGTGINISTFDDGESCLQNVTAKTNIVILDYYMPGQNGLDILKLIKLKNPKTEVIMLSSNEDMGLAVESFRNGAMDYVIKGPKSWTKVMDIVYYIITAPVRLLVREFRVSKFMAIFLLTFVIMGIVVASVLRYMNWN